MYIQNTKILGVHKSQLPYIKKLSLLVGLPLFLVSVVTQFVLAIVMIINQVYYPVLLFLLFIFVIIGFGLLRFGGSKITALGKMVLELVSWIV